VADKPMIKLKNAFEARLPAEKAIIAFIVAAAIFYLYLIWVSDPVKADIATLKLQISNNQTRTTALEARELRAGTGSRLDPNLAARKQLEELIAKQANAREQLGALTGSVIGPVEMNSLLTDVLRLNSGLYLRRIANSGARRVAGGGAGQQVFRHDLRLEFEGDYLSTLKYLVYLEGLSENFYWDSISIVPTQWPSASVMLELHTLSSQESFVGV
jgi:MSHA biogenesis protein MshJ